MKTMNTKTRKLFAVSRKVGEQHIIRGLLLTVEKTSWQHEPDGSLRQKPEVVGQELKKLIFATPDDLTQFAAQQGLEYVHLLKVQDGLCRLPSKKVARKVEVKVERRVREHYLSTLDNGLIVPQHITTKQLVTVQRTVVIGPAYVQRLDTEAKEALKALVLEVRAWEDQPAPVVETTAVGEPEQTEQKPEAKPIPPRQMVWAVKVQWTTQEDTRVQNVILHHADLATLKRQVKGFTNKLRTRQKAGEDIHLNRLPKGAYQQVAL